LGHIKDATSLFLTPKLSKGMSLPATGNAMLRNFPPKLLWAMRLSSIIFLLGGLHVSAGALSQNVTISGKDLPLVQVFENIKQQTGYSFVYDIDDIARMKHVNVHASNVPLKDLLDDCFRGQPFTWSIVNKTIVVTERQAVAGPPSSDETPVPPDTRDEIHGVVVDSNYSRMANATVAVKGKKIFTETDDRGNFTLTGTPIRDSNVVIIVSYTGYETQTYVVHKGSGNGVVVRMKPSTSQLDQVEIVAYGTTTQRYNVGSITTVTSQDIESQPVDNFLEALQGRVTGLQITAPSGAPGAMVLAQIRGQNTMSGNLNANGGVALSNYDQPLYIIDGIPFAPQNNSLLTSSMFNIIAGAPGQQNNNYGGMSPLNSIDPHDIESISVLKDADATAIYGSRGANGVILITTKRGRPGKMGLSVNASSGPTTAARNVKMMNTQQYLQMRHEALANDNLSPSIGPGRTDYDLLVMDTTRDVDYYHQLLGKTAQHQTANVSLTGGTTNASYRVSGGYRRTTFDYPGDFSDQLLSFNSGLNITSPDNRFSMSLSTVYSYDNNQNCSSIGTANMINLPPDFPAFVDASGKLLWSYKGVPFSSISNETNNFYAGLQQPFSAQNNNLNLSSTISYKIIRGLSIGGTAGYSRFESQLYSASPIATINPAFDELASAQFQNSLAATIDIEPQVVYQRTFGKLSINATLGGTYQTQSGSGTSINASGYPNDALLNSIAGAASVSATSNNLVTKYVAAFGRITLAWDGRYLLNLTGNNNGSSLFGPGYRWGQFGSAGAGWIFSETRLVRQALPWLSFGKVTANVGVTGSNSVQPYQYQPNWQGSGSYSTYQGSSYYMPLNPYTPDYHWATKHDFNARLSLGFFHDWAVIDGGVYLNYTGNQLLGTPLPTQTGFTSVTNNAPYTMQNKGWDISITPNKLASRTDKRNGFVWNAPQISISSRNYNKVTRVAANSPYAGVLIKGQSFGVVPLIKFAGVDSATGVFEYFKADGKTKTVSPVDFSALTPFGASQGGDANQLYNPSPAITIGFGDGFSWKGLKVGFYGSFQKQQGYTYLYNVFSGSYNPGFPSYNEPAAIVGKEWKRPGDKAPLRKYSSFVGDYNFAQSTGALGNASYLRISNLDISYQLPNSFVRRIRMQQGSIYVHVQNLLTITPYKVGDPEAQTIYNIPPQRVIAGGVSFNF
jgi:TonB-linked SusC/RagA family outer membrane protein